MRPCQACRHEIPDRATTCPHCGASFAAEEGRNGWGFEYKSEATLLGLPLLHISFKYRPSRIPVPAKGVIAIGQFACGIITLSQFGLGVVSIGQVTVAALALAQFSVAAYALAQFAFAYSLIAQFGIYIHEGHGQFSRSLHELLEML